MVKSADGFSGVETDTAMPSWYPELLGSVSRHVSVGWRRTVSATTQELVLTYWRAGHEILERQSYEGYGTQVVNRLSADFKRRFPDATGFSPRNLRHTRAFANQKAPIGVAEWATQLTESLPSEPAASLPSIETLETELSTSRDEDVE
jgi:hypothetical protein